MTCWSNESENAGRDLVASIYNMLGANQFMAEVIGGPVGSTLSQVFENVMAGNSPYAVEFDPLSFGPDFYASFGAIANASRNWGHGVKFLLARPEIPRHAVQAVEYFTQTEQLYEQSRQVAEEFFPGGGGRGDCEDNEEPAPDDDLPDPNDDDNDNDIPDRDETGNGSGGGRDGPPDGSGMGQRPSDPLVLDLDGDGIELIAVGQSSAHFDIDLDGFAEHVGWVGADDGLLALDRDGNGEIDNIGELFGTATENGFSVLGAYDGNHDGRIDQTDVIFSQLRVWRDSNGDGDVDVGELNSLISLGIAHVGLQSQAVGRFSAGNFIEAQGTFAYSGGSTGLIAAVWFSIDQTESRYQTPENFTLHSEAFILPIIVGYGNVRDLSVAISESPALRQRLLDIVMSTASPDYASLRTSVEDLITDWFRIDEVALNDRGSNVDRHKLAVVETFFGTTYWQASLDTRSADFIEGKYAEIVDMIFMKILVQSPLSYVAHQTGISDMSAALINHPLSGFLAFRYEPADDSISGSMETLVSLISRTVTDIESLGNAGDFVRLTKAAVFSGDERAFGAALAYAIDSTSNNSLGISDEALFHALVYGVAVGGGAGADHLTTAVQSVYMAGLGGNDTIDGSDGNEMLDGGRGDDNLSGRDGSDKYIFNAGDGVDRIEDNGFRDNDRLLVHGHSASGVTLARSGNDLTLRFAGSNDAITIVNTLENDTGDHVEEIVFDDGTTWNQAYLQPRLIAEQQTLGNDIVTGFDSREDVLAGGRGNDTLNGKDGSDSYVFNAGDGIDRIEDNGFRDNDRLLVHGHSASGVTLTRSGNDLTLRFAGSNDAITIVNTLENDTGDHVEEIVFDDGTTWNQAYLQPRLIAEQQTLGNDIVTGFDSREDVLAGGRGNDTLNGKDGSDSYVFNAGDGIDRIEDNGFRDNDRLLVHGHSASGVTLTRSGNDLTLRFAGSNDAITIVNTLENDTGDHVEEIVFDDGTIWDHLYIQYLLTGVPGPSLILGGMTGDQLFGTDGNDSIYAYEGNDVAWGGPGTDRIFGAGGADILGGDAGPDTISGGGDNDTIYGGSENDQLKGGDGADFILGDHGDDVITGDQGHDQLYGFDGDDWLEGGEGDDLLSGEGGSDQMIGDAGNDTLISGSGNDVMSGGSGNDIMIGGSSASAMFGGAGNDTFYVSDTSDAAVEAAGEGDDRVAASVSYVLPAGSAIEVIEAITLSATTALNFTGNALDQTLIGNAGANVLTGGGGNDSMLGLGGDDVLIGGSSASAMFGGAGNDTYYVSDTSDAVVELSGEGNDRIAASVSHVLLAGSAVETLEAITLGATNAMNLTGNVFNNIIVGNDGANVLSGGGGNDALVGAGGDDVLIGGSSASAMFGGTGNDTYYVADTSDAVSEAAGQGADRIAASVSYVLAANSEVERIEAVNSTATTAINLTGSASGNSIAGNAGANVLNGAGGTDVLAGLGGADTFAFTTALGPGNVDQIVDFVHNVDKIALDGTLFSLAPGALAAGAFAIGGTATDSGDRIVYDAATGRLYFDSDGVGPAAMIQFASLVGAPALTASDFVVI
jgi:Ca2+-binding RTX toxin-like protein